MKRALAVLAMFGVGAALFANRTEPEPPPRVVERFDDGLADARYGFAHGDPSAGPRLAQWVRWERLRPATGPLAQERQRLVDAALKGVGPLDGRHLSLEAARAIHEADSTCSEADDTCLALLEQLLLLPTDPFGEHAMLDPLPVDEVPPDLTELTIAPELLVRAASWVANGEDPAARLMDTVARKPHAYRGWALGQRGEPLDVLRYGTGSPGAVAVTALVLGERAGVPVTVEAGDGLLMVSAGVHRAVLNQCGPTTIVPHSTTPLTLEHALDIARMDHVAALDFVGRAGDAIQASSRVKDPRRWPGMEHVHGALLASQGLALPGWTPGPSKQPCRLSVEERSTD